MSQYWEKSSHVAHKMIIYVKVSPSSVLIMTENILRDNVI